MRIDVLTLFPEALAPMLRVGVLGRALDAGLLTVSLTNPRDFARDKRRTVDDAPYGGGAGMVMRCEPLFDAVESLRDVNSLERVILLSPRGRVFNQQVARELAGRPDMALICARYEGVDARVAQRLATDEISIGDYVLSGGEAAALVVIEAVSRMVPGVVGKWESVDSDSFFHGLLGPPQYTRPPVFRGDAVPPVLLEGNHAAIERWRRSEALRATRARRPDLLQQLSDEDLELLAGLGDEPPTPEKENES
ncbi:MAG TPA: tRNA (guanosine(37)-N1)-methyltransferase TrmD [Candidatus Hydrogenedentes bacterium]|nr:tRNA (guanosine(37)-N1)-methyltransferase TrmD [Candidatus Hydrogenedentota bacterium]